MSREVEQAHNEEERILADDTDTKSKDPICHGTDDDGTDSDRTRRLSSFDKEESFLRRKMTEQKRSKRTNNVSKRTVTFETLRKKVPDSERSQHDSKVEGMRRQREKKKKMEKKKKRSKETSKGLKDMFIEGEMDVNQETI